MSILNTETSEVDKILSIGFSDSVNPYNIHLRSKLTVLTYLRIADEISQQLPTDGSKKILDWGAGMGHMSYLLHRRNYKVTSFHYVEKRGEEKNKVSTQNDTLFFADQIFPLIKTTDPVKLPFSDNQFDAVLSSGVLEHVSNEIGSLREIKRILKPGGFFFIYQLPRKSSWLEFIVGLLKLGYVHERKYTIREIKEILDREGFNVKYVRPANMLPKNFTGIPSFIKKAFERFPNFILKIDHILARIPILNLISGIVEISACKR